MQTPAFELLPLGEGFAAAGETEEEDERGRIARAGLPRARPRPRPAPRPAPRPPARSAPRRPPPRRQPIPGGFPGGFPGWPPAWPPGGYVTPWPLQAAALPAPAPACDCGAPAGSDTAAPPADDADSNADAAELFEVEAFEFEAPAARPVLRRGSRGSAVSDLQRRLAAAGHSPGAVDGIFGSLTDSAVRRFQQARALTVDGVVGPMTWGALLGGGTRPPPSPTPAPVPAGTAPRWVLPEAVRLAGEAQRVRYDSPPPWTGNPGNCSGDFTAGAETLRAHIQATFAGVTSIGGYSCRQNTANTAETSVHGVGRALDIMITPIAGQANAAAGDRIANWLVSNAQAIGVQYVIWNRVRWSGSASGRKDASYGGPNPHIDHIHAEINLDAAARRTPWFVGR